MSPVMRRLLVAIFVTQLAASTLIAWAQTSQTPLDDARASIDAQRYDDAVALLEKYISQNPNSADAELLLAQAYHWKKDIAKAKLHYQKAAAIDPQNQLEIVPLLDEEGAWAEIIRLCAPAVSTGERSPSILGALASAYKNSKKPLDAQRIRNLLATATYTSQSNEDYRNYVLAYCALWENDAQQAKDRLRKIHDSAFLKYARTDDKFKKLFTDEEFLELTK
jgi:cytochrome c-type biogenesis protein CcmH/NrfG